MGTNLAGTGGSRPGRHPTPRSVRLAWRTSTTRSAPHPPRRPHRLAQSPPEQPDRTRTPPRPHLALAPPTDHPHRDHHHGSGSECSTGHRRRVRGGHILRCLSWRRATDLLPSTQEVCRTPGASPGESSWSERGRGRAPETVLRVSRGTKPPDGPCLEVHLPSVRHLQLGPELEGIRRHVCPAEPADITVPWETTTTSPYSTAPMSPLSNRLTASSRGSHPASASLAR